MKHNLKTRPYLNNYPESASRKKLEEYADKCVEWFEDFKEELQQLKQRYKNSKQTGKYLIIDAIDEILGTKP